MTLLFGKNQSLMNQSGSHLGEKVDQDGTLSALLWLLVFSKSIQLIFTQEELIFDSLIMTMKLHNLRLITSVTIGLTIFGILVTCIFKARRCQNHWKISLQLNKFCRILIQDKFVSYFCFILGLHWWIIQPKNHYQRLWAKKPSLLNSLEL